MPRFFFHIVEGRDFIPDEEGSVLPDLDAAKAEARASARDIARQAIAQRRRPSDACVEIQDGDGRVLASLSVGEILEHPRDPAYRETCGASVKGPLH